MEGRVSTRVELKVGARRVWEAMTREDNVVPMLLPEFISNINYTKGHGSIGSIRRLNFGHDELIEEMNSETRTQVYSIIGGDLLNYFSLYKVTLHVVEVESQDNACQIDWSVEYKSPFPNMQPPKMARDGAIKTFKALEAYLANKSG